MLNESNDKHGIYNNIIITLERPGAEATECVCVWGGGGGSGESGLNMLLAKSSP